MNISKISYTQDAIINNKSNNRIRNNGMSSVYFNNINDEFEKSTNNVSFKAAPKFLTKITDLYKLIKNPELLSKTAPKFLTESADSEMILKYLRENVNKAKPQKWTKEWLLYTFNKEYRELYNSEYYYNTELDDVFAKNPHYEVISSVIDEYTPDIIENSGELYMETKRLTSLIELCLEQNSSPGAIKAIFEKFGLERILKSYYNTIYTALKNNKSFPAVKEIIDNVGFKFLLDKYCDELETITRYRLDDSIRPEARDIILKKPEVNKYILEQLSSKIENVPEQNFPYIVPGAFQYNLNINKIVDTIGKDAILKMEQNSNILERPISLAFLKTEEPEAIKNIFEMFGKDAIIALEESSEQGPITDAFINNNNVDVIKEIYNTVGKDSLLALENKELFCNIIKNGPISKAIMYNQGSDTVAKICELTGKDELLASEEQTNGNGFISRGFECKNVVAIKKIIELIGKDKIIELNEKYGLISEKLFSRSRTKSKEGQKDLQEIFKILSEDIYNYEKNPQLVTNSILTLMTKTKSSYLMKVVIDTIGKDTFFNILKDNKNKIDWDYLCADIYDGGAAIIYNLREIYGVDAVSDNFTPHARNFVELLSGF